MHITSPDSSIPFKRRRPSILKQAYGINLFNSSGWWWDASPSFTQLKSECLKIDPLISLPKRWLSSSAYSEFPDPATFLSFLTLLWLLMALVVFDKSTHYNVIIFKILKDITIFKITGSFVNFSKLLWKYFKLPALGRLEILEEIEMLSWACIWLNSVGDRSLEMSRSNIWENSIPFFSISKICGPFWVKEPLALLLSLKTRVTLESDFVF